MILLALMWLTDLLCRVAATIVGGGITFVTRSAAAGVVRLLRRRHWSLSD